MPSSTSAAMLPMDIAQHEENVNIPTTEASNQEDRTSAKPGQTGPRTSRSMQSRYEEMLLEDVPLSNHILASFFTWVGLAGFLVLPGSFSWLETVQTTSRDVRKVLHAVRNIHLYVPLFELASLFEAFQNRIYILSVLTCMVQPTG